MMTIPLIPAWTIVILTGVVAVDNIFRYREEGNLLLIGKALAWGLAMLIYLVISLDVFDIAIARAFSRLAWVIVPATEIAYRYAKKNWST